MIEKYYEEFDEILDTSKTIKEKRMRLDELNNKNNVIFKYQLIDATTDSALTMIIITTDKKDNVWIQEAIESEDYIDFEYSYKTVDSNIIKDIISKYSNELSKCKKKIKPKNIIVDDGTDSYFYFKNDNESYSIRVNNFTYCIDNKDIALLTTIHKEIYKKLEPLLGDKIENSFLLNI